MMKLYLIWAVYVTIGLVILYRTLSHKDEESNNVVGSLAFVCLWPGYITHKIVKKIKNEFKKFYTFLVKKR